MRAAVNTRGELKEERSRLHSEIEGRWLRSGSDRRVRIRYSSSRRARGIAASVHFKMSFLTGNFGWQPKSQIPLSWHPETGLNSAPAPQDLRHRLSLIKAIPPLQWKNLARSKQKKAQRLTKLGIISYSTPQWPGRHAMTKESFDSLHELPE
jgi:hypothetical protein